MDALKGDDIYPGHINLHSKMASRNNWWLIGNRMHRERRNSAPASEAKFGLPFAPKRSEHFTLQAHQNQ